MNKITTIGQGEPVSPGAKDKGHEPTKQKGRGAQASNCNL